MKKLSLSVEAHYSRGPDYGNILKNLRRKKIELDHVRPEDLYPYDQTHAGGIEATRKLAAFAAIPEGSTVVDVGCGIGGAARSLHAQFSCRVVGVELAFSRIRTAKQLHRLMGNPKGLYWLLAQGDILPLPSGFADVLWTQHLTMNLPDHAGFVQECARVLKPTGRLACHEWFQKRSGDFPYPLPWASVPSLNHVISVEEFLRLSGEAGFAATAEEVTADMLPALESNMQALRRNNAPAERIRAIQNLVQATRDGLFHCWMIVEKKAK